MPVKLFPFLSIKWCSTQYSNWFFSFLLFLFILENQIKEDRIRTQNQTCYWRVQGNFILLQTTRHIHWFLHFMSVGMNMQRLLWLDESSCKLIHNDILNMCCTLSYMEDQHMTKWNVNWSRSAWDWVYIQTLESSSSCVKWTVFDLWILHIHKKEIKKKLSINVHSLSDEKGEKPSKEWNERQVCDVHCAGCRGQRCWSCCGLERERPGACGGGGGLKPAASGSGALLHEQTEVRHCTSPEPQSICRTVETTQNTGRSVLLALMWCLGDLQVVRSLTSKLIVSVTYQSVSKC